MSKIMLVEDDNNLREIYGARLLAEGYEIVAAQDGEEALALAVKEKPDLIISDVMMPRISGFDMLDILRNAPETKETKVIMMTALSQAEDKARADKLGADRYLVKSQVTLEDVTNVVHEVLGDLPADDAAPSAPAAAAPVAPAPAVPEATVTDLTAAQPTPTSDPVPEPVVPPVIEPGPSVPDTIVQTEPVAEPVVAPQTVEAIANPQIEVAGEAEAAEVQAPPVVTEPVATPAAPALPDQPPPQTPAPAAAPEEDLPPIVEPASIKVELPSLSGNKPADEPALPEAPVIETAAIESPHEPKPDFVGPSLAEALASEEEQAADDTQSSNRDLPNVSLPESPSIANGVATNNVVAPTKIEVQTEPEPAAEPAAPEPPLPAATVTPLPTATVTAPTLPDEPDVNEPVVVTPTQAPPVEAAPQPPSTPTPEVSGEKVIQPLNDPETTPNINELLAAEERKAAVNNPAASTVITPGGLPQSSGAVQPAPVPAAQTKKDELNNISL